MIFWQGSGPGPTWFQQFSFFFLGLDPVQPLMGLIQPTQLGCDQAGNNNQASMRAL
jgi:hypothetical protein